MLKPFEIEDLHSAIQVALHKHRAERELKRKKKAIVNTLRNIGYAVFSSDKKGVITYINPQAETLSGFKENEALGKNLNEVLKFHYGERLYDPITLIKKLRTKRCSFTFKCYIDFMRNSSVAQKYLVNFVPAHDKNGRADGAVLVFRPERDEKRAKFDFISANTPESDIGKETKVISLALL